MGVDNSDRPSPNLKECLSTTAFAFRGYNVTNLGRTRELLAVGAYRKVLLDWLEKASACCTEVLGAPVDLQRRVEAGEEADLDHYGEAIGIIYAVEMAQIDLLREVHEVEYFDSSLAFGYSLGELIAAACGGAFPGEEVLRVPLAMASDCAELAQDVTMAIVFSRGAALYEETIHHICEEITCEGEGTLGVSAVLSPNTMLLLGQGDTIKRAKPRLHKEIDTPIHIRLNDSLWPPLHTPIVWQKQVVDRASCMISKIPRLEPAHTPPILSLVTGKQEYMDEASREVLRRWIDHPQRLWDAVVGVLTRDIRTIVHVGPEPNVIPATFHRLSDNVEQQTGDWSIGGIGMRAVQHIANRPWLSALLPHQGSLLRAPAIEHVVLEDWLIDNAPK